MVRSIEIRYSTSRNIDYQCAMYLLKCIIGLLLNKPLKFTNNYYSI